MLDNSGMFSKIILKGSNCVSQYLKYTIIPDDKYNLKDTYINKFLNSSADLDFGFYTNDKELFQNDSIVKKHLSLFVSKLIN